MENKGRYGRFRGGLPHYGHVFAFFVAYSLGKATRKEKRKRLQQKGNRWKEMKEHTETEQVRKPSFPMARDLFDYIRQLYIYK